MSTTKKPAKSPEELQAALQKLIAQGRKEGMIRAADLATHLEAMDLSPERIEEIYDQFEAMNIQIISAELDLDLDDAMAEGDIDLASGRYVVDGKSIMGIFSLDLSQPIQMTVHSEDTAALEKTIADYLV